MRRFKLSEEGVLSRLTDGTERKRKRKGERMRGRKRVQQKERERMRKLERERERGRENERESERGILSERDIGKIYSLRMT